ncbi:winged helix-turn-helix transcriptional regulator [Pseudonocardia acaciae]|uniref:winged helix-turn-helix transcriptional regulator n=1 Tax=Pseudonocardia acaciae TaxID=551276 RepID=UPI000491B8C9|nr:helix-turn-helix domain-containing protein [Pseudonocardia acaciae]
MHDWPADEQFCPRYHHAVELIGKRWTGVVLRALLSGHQRYADIRRAVPGLSDTMLSERLRELEAENIVVRHVLAGPPTRVEYRLTDKGQALNRAVAAIAEWAEEWVPAP